jgi:hypothetical protein
LEAALERADGVDVPAVIAGYERGLIPLKDVEPRGMSVRDPSKEGALTSKVRDALSLLATKIAPTMPLEQVDAWIRVTSAALSNLPGRVAHDAAEQALYRPMKFINEVETVIREEADDIQTRHRLALRRLRMLQEAIERGPAPALPANDYDAETAPVTAEQIRSMSRHPAWQNMKDMGLQLGSFTQADVDAALAEDAEQAA